MVIMFVGTKSDLVDQKVVSEDMGGEVWCSTAKATSLVPFSQHDCNTIILF